MTSAIPDPILPICPVCSRQAQYDFSGRDLMFGLFRRHDYFLCPGCEAVFQHPMPRMDEIASFYPPDYCVYDEEDSIRRISGWRRAILKQTRGYAHLDVIFPLGILAGLFSPFLKPIGTPIYVDGGRMLDVGCGNGRYMATMRALGWQVEGVEFNESGVQVCRKANLQVHHGDMFSAEFNDERFDLITVRHVIEHIPEPQPFLSELARTLKPGGMLVIETPNSSALGRAWFGPNWYANDVPRHLILFNPNNLSLLADCYGLQVVNINLETSPKIFLNSVDYVTRKQGKPSKKIRWRRILARIYVLLAKHSGRGDTLRLVMTK